jgi:S1-C subfamily serine protease
MILRRGEFISELPQNNGNNILAHSAEVFPGNSGGPLLNECGQVAGINTFIIWSTTDGASTGPQVKTDFALPADDLALFLKSEQITLVSASKSCD